MPNSRISDEQVDENAANLYRHFRFLPTSVLTKSPHEIAEMFDKGILIENSDGDIEEISVMTQALTENEIKKSRDIQKEGEYYLWNSLTSEEKLNSDPDRYADELNNDLKENPEEVQESDKELK